MEYRCQLSVWGELTNVYNVGNDSESGLDLDHAELAELVDALDSGSSVCKDFRVQVPGSALIFCNKIPLVSHDFSLIIVLRLMQSPVWPGQWLKQVIVISMGYTIETSSS